MHNKYLNIKGITLPEVVTVVAIIGILAGFATLSMDMVRKERLSSATSQLLADVQKARLDGMLSSSPTLTTIRGVGIRFESPSSYTIFTYNDCNDNFAYDSTGCTGDTPEEINVISKTVSSSISLNVGIGSQFPPPQPTTPSNAVLIFDKLGYPRQANWDSADVWVKLQYSALSDIKCIHIGTDAIREGVWNDTTCREK